MDHRIYHICAVVAVICGYRKYRVCLTAACTSRNTLCRSGLDNAVVIQAYHSKTFTGLHQGLGLCVPPRIYPGALPSSYPRQLLSSNPPFASTTQPPFLLAPFNPPRCSTPLGKVRLMGNMHEACGTQASDGAPVIRTTNAGSSPDEVSDASFRPRLADL